MILIGDEFGRTQLGNNNAYCIDSPLTWVDWDLLTSHQHLYKYVSALIKFRHQHPCLRTNSFDDKGISVPALPSCSFHGNEPWNPDWSPESRQLAWMFSCDHPGGDQEVDVVYVIANMAHYATWFDLPVLPEGQPWQLAFNTGDSSHPVLPGDVPFSGQGLLVGERSVVIMTS